jgi:isoleucyl-tRNA synthetase
MAEKFKEYKKFDLSQVNKDVLDAWTKNDTFHKSLKLREGKPSYVFYEGPPSANGLPGIHHVMARTIKDIFCRYKTNKGFHVKRKAGWDTHGLPVELGVEKTLGITKEDIGKKITVAEYNDACKTDVMKFTNVWEDITDKMGYWVDMEHPYITYTSDYIETLWWLLKELYNKGWLYKGYTIQPYSPAAGTGLSSHELNLPGCYKDVKDTTAVALFKIERNEKSEFLYKDIDNDAYFMAWTTTPWTLLSNTALAVGGKIEYQKIQTFNPYSGDPITVVVAKDLAGKYFPEKNAEIAFEDYKTGDKKVPFKILSSHKGKEFDALKYEQLLPYQQPEDGDAFRVVVGNFVTTEDGTGIVHIAPSFGADDFKVAKENGVGSLTLVDKTGRFVDGVGEFSGRFVKKAYDASIPEDTDEIDVDIVVKLKKEGKLFKAEKYEHSYPHCWRTDKPILYYPLDSWFIKTTASKDRMIELNKTINWQPSSTGTGRFGQWLENLVDWNLSRSRYWGTPLPIWRTEDGEEEICIGSYEELQAECEKSVKAGLMNENPLKDFNVGDYTKENYEKINPHRPHVDNIVLVSPSGKPMKREMDLIDVWFDSGAMPYAQMHYPFENKAEFEDFYPADFIAEGVDQTRGWFFTLHAIATMLFDSVAFKNIVSNGLVLDKKGNKMSKRLGNAVDPFETIENHGSDPLRWYMMTNASPWDNLKFDLSGIEEVKRKFFGTLYNTYSFFVLYANVDGFTFKEREVPLHQRQEIDQWIISLLNTLVKEVEQHYENYDPTKAGRAIQNFVTENLSNWYVRLNRKRFWGGKYDADKISAYQTLYTCLETVSQLMAPIAPFYADQLFMDLNKVSGKHDVESIHLGFFPSFNDNAIDKGLEERMDIAQRVSSMVLSLRRKESIKVRQPLSKIMIPVLDDAYAQKIDAVKSIILTETNIKEIEYLKDATGVLVKKIKPDFKLLGKRLGKSMKHVAGGFAKFTQEDIAKMEKDGKFVFNVEGQSFEISLDEVEITSQDIPGWLVAVDGPLTVALDITITEELKLEGIAREFINRIQNLRKDSGFDVTDKINIEIQKHPAIDEAINIHKSYIGTQTLANSINLVEEFGENNAKKLELDDDVATFIKIEKVQ